jgi:hypothetical protein
MRKFKIFSSFLVVVLFISFFSFNPASGYFIQLKNEGYGESLQYFYYDKYNIAVGWSQEVYDGSSYSEGYGGVGMGNELYTDWTYNDAIGYIGQGVGPQGLTSAIATPNTYYYGCYNSPTKRSRQVSINRGTQSYYKFTYEVWVRNPIDVKGNLIQSNIVAPDGMYPNNGKHTDGYWYVKGAVANLPPTITSSTPTQNASLSFPTDIRFSITDPDTSDTVKITSIDISGEGGGSKNNVIKYANCSSYTINTLVPKGTEFFISASDWFPSLGLENHTITINYADNTVGTGTYTNTITRFVAKPNIAPKTPTQNAALFLN